MPGRSCPGTGWCGFLLKPPERRNLREGVEVGDISRLREQSPNGMRCPGHSSWQVVQIQDIRPFILKNSRVHYVSWLCCLARICKALQVISIRRKTDDEVMYPRLALRTIQAIASAAVADSKKQKLLLPESCKPLLSSSLTVNPFL